MRTCKVCKNEKEDSVFISGKRTNRTCKQCLNLLRRAKYQAKPKVSRVPWNKGKTTPLEVREKQSKAAIGRKHSKETCHKMSETRRKKELGNGRLSTKYKNWRYEVFERDSHACTSCGSKKNLHPHHIKNWTDHPRFRFDVDNGTTLCKSCHGKVDGFQNGSKINKGRIMSSETRKRMSEAAKGRTLSKDHRKKIADGLTNHYAKRKAKS